MYNVNELWNSPWRDLQQSLADALAEQRSAQHHDRLPPYKSWLGRAQILQQQGVRLAR